MPSRRKKYTKAEKLELVKLSLSSDETVKGLSARFGISQNTLYNWRRTYLTYEEASFPGHGHKTMTDSERKISELERALREAELERDILKKAVGIFSKSGRKFSNS